MYLSRFRILHQPLCQNGLVKRIILIQLYIPTVKQQNSLSDNRNLIYFAYPIIIIFLQKSQKKKIMLDKIQRLKIAFVTDIHLNKTAITKLSQWTNIHYNTQPKFDYCLIGGDTANCNHDKLDHNQQDMFNNTCQVHKKIKDIFNCKLFFVPGNHDCKFFFQNDGQAQGFYNIHNKRINISDGLDLVGFGGSEPGYVNGEEVWSGYPFKNDKQFGESWQKSDILNDKSKNTNQVLLMTHMGPALSETTLDRSQYPKTVTTGSEHLNKLYSRKDIVGWFHGHTHNGSNNSKVLGIEVINPGPLALNRFMHFELIKQDTKWKISKKCFELL